MLGNVPATGELAALASPHLERIQAAAAAAFAPTAVLGSSSIRGPLAKGSRRSPPVAAPAGTLQRIEKAAETSGQTPAEWLRSTPPRARAALPGGTHHRETLTPDTGHAWIGIGEDRRSRSFPSHTTRHAGPHLAVR